MKVTIEIEVEDDIDRSIIPYQVRLMAARMEGDFMRMRVADFELHQQLHKLEQEKKEAGNEK